MAMKLKAAAALLLAAHLAAAMAQDPGWPRELKLERARMTYYEPQVDSWKKFSDLEFRFALELKPADGNPVVGIAVVKARTDVDVGKRTVMLSKLSVVSTRFPSADDAAARQLDHLFRQFIAARQEIVISLDRLIAATEKKEAPKGVTLKNDPPAIFVSYQPAILVQSDGKPQLAPTGKGKLQFIVNANWPVFHDPDAGRWYLFNGSHWSAADRLTGPWTRITQLPLALLQTLQEQQWVELKKVSATTDNPRTLPAVFYSDVPAEMIIFNGKPTYTPIRGTELVYANNTDADLFVYTRTRDYYYLAAGRWFRASSLQGPWTFASAGLPADFAKIPQDSPASRVLASVPGTEAAKDAVLLAQVPTRALIDPRAAEKDVEVKYDGAPQFKPIENTSLTYAVNTADRIIRVDNQYYLVRQGIWFVSNSPNGPWTTAQSVPSQVYTIPPSSPVYNVTYVTQTTTTSGYVESSYTAGYYGAFIMGAAFGSILCNGSGYYYPPYYHYPPVGYPVYRPYGATYGVGSVYNPYTGAYGVSRGVYGPAGRGFTGGASYNPYTGSYARAGTAYGPYGSRSAGAAYNPYTGAYARAGAASGPYGSTAYAAAGNRATGSAAATRQSAGAYGQWGSSVVRQGGNTALTRHASTATGSIGSVQSSSGARAVAGSGARGSGAAAVSAGGDLYAGRDGNVYRRSGDTWQRYDNGGWNSTAVQPGQGRARAGEAAGVRPATQTSAIPQNVNRDFQARQRGGYNSQRFNSYQRSSSFQRGGGGFSGGGGSRGGGGRRR
jgi:hypothetical protein